MICDSNIRVKRIGIRADSERCKGIKFVSADNSEICSWSGTKADWREQDLRNQEQIIGVYGKITNEPTIANFGFITMSI